MIYTPNFIGQPLLSQMVNLLGKHEVMRLIFSCVCSVSRTISSPALSITTPQASTCSPPLCDGDSYRCGAVTILPQNR